MGHFVAWCCVSPESWQVLGLFKVLFDRDSSMFIYVGWDIFGMTLEILEYEAAVVGNWFNRGRQYLWSRSTQSCTFHVSQIHSHQKKEILDSNKSEKDKPYIVTLWDVFVKVRTVFLVHHSQMQTASNDAMPLYLSITVIYLKLQHMSYLVSSQ